MSCWLLFSFLLPTLNTAADTACVLTGFWNHCASDMTDTVTPQEFKNTFQNNVQSAHPCQFTAHKQPHRWLVLHPLKTACLLLTQTNLSSLTRCGNRHHNPDPIPRTSRRPSVLLQLLGNIADGRLREGECLQVCVSCTCGITPWKTKLFCPFWRTLTIRLMIWALESSPPATVRQTDAWSGWP